MMSDHIFVLSDQNGDLVGHMSFEEKKLFAALPWLGCLSIAGYPKYFVRLQFTSTHLYSWVERGTVIVKCLAQELSTQKTPVRPGSMCGPKMVYIVLFTSLLFPHQ